MVDVLELVLEARGVAGLFAGELDFFRFLYWVLSLTEEGSFFLPLQHKPPQTLLAILLKLLTLKNIRIKIMYHLFGMFLKTYLINPQIQQVDLSQEQHRRVVHNHTDHLVNVIGFLVFGLGDRLEGA